MPTSRPPSAAGCDVVFQPSVAEMYPAGEPEVTVDPGPLGDRLEGAERPGHFRGVLTVVAKLFGLAGPCRAFFGEKDAQQLALIRRMVRDLDLPIEIVRVPDRARARRARALLAQRAAVARPSGRPRRCCGGRSATAAASSSAASTRPGGSGRRWPGVVASQPLAQLDYAAVVDLETWEDVERIRRPVRLLIAARIGATRLIDNATASPPAFAAPAADAAGPAERGE